MRVLGKLFIVSAPSGGGKTSLIHALVERSSNINVSISHTTRPPRQGEKDGVNYFFVDEDTFKQYQEQGIFLEYAKVFNHWYGTSKKWVMAQLEAGNDVILEIDWQGARKIKEQMECVSIFILPPSREALQTRLNTRRQDSPAVIEGRMLAASNEISHYAEYDYVVVNEIFDDALLDLEAIIRSQKLKMSYQKERYSTLLAQLT